jgi:two-component system sensor histidine kinase UhpB
MTANVLFHLTICGFVGIVFIVSVYFSFRGEIIARDLLWGWALLLLLAIPLASLFAARVTDYLAGLLLLLFFYAIFVVVKRSRDRLGVAQDEIRRLLAESNNRMDEERRRIARRLHDDINPRLVLAKIELEQLLSVLERLEPEGDPARRAISLARSVKDSISAIYLDSREIIRNTRIEVIDSIGLTAAVESLAIHYRGILDRVNIVVNVDLANVERLPSIISVNAYRIIQEALLNAVKHAAAASITVSICQKSARVDVSILDDGVGFDAKAAPGIGLIDMRERTRVLGGELQIRTGFGEGTRISFSFLRRE